MGYFNEKLPTELPKKLTATVLVAALLLGAMALLMLVESSEKSTIVDESPHIVAGYAYVVKQDYRLNPEHPPLIKMAAGLPLAFQDVKFIEGRKSWEEDLNGQWTGGDEFLHWQGNNPRNIMFWSRLGPMVITLLLGVLIFVWTRKLYGNIAGIFALTLFTFSPNFLAHGPLVTTDVGAAFAFVFASYFFFKYLKNQTRKNLIWAGVAFGIAQLMKFSLVLIIPFFTVATLMWVFTKDRPMELWSGEMAKRVFKYFGKLLAIGVIGLIVVYPAYLYTVWDYPIERQVRDAEWTLRSHPWNTAPGNWYDEDRDVQGLPASVVKMSENPVLRPYAQFFLGHLMVFQRVAGGNTVYYLGDIANTAWRSYFPVVFMLKVPLALLAMLGIATYAASKAGIKQAKIALRGVKGLGGKFKRFVRLKAEWISKYFIEFSFAFFIFMYWVISIMGNLNIGVRHVLPTFPFIYMLLAGILQRWVQPGLELKGLTMMEKIQSMFAAIFKGWMRGAIVLVLVIWYVFSPLATYPHMLSYFNALAGGSDDGYKYVVDSNYDWGQDMYKLQEFVEENNIDKIKVDYFGGANPDYYLEDKFEWFNPRDPGERHGWIAVSATLMMGGRGEATKGFEPDTTYYEWIEQYEPVARA
ncbi:MAG: glycosyltransferase family 39 protein, partial [Candidatus Spechtbacterales bacterium]|nr:glycosyltransferase family 39 protein [Candidatus Spechtbacterales bacterium]